MGCYSNTSKRVEIQARALRRYFGKTQFARRVATTWKRAKTKSFKKIFQSRFASARNDSLGVRRRFQKNI